MKFLVDNVLFQMIVAGWQRGGYDAIHVREYGLQASEDEVIFDRAAGEDRIIISADTDFGTLFALRHVKIRSGILLRRLVQRRPDRQLSLLLSNLGQVAEGVREGALAVFEETRRPGSVSTPTAVLSHPT